MILLYKNNNRFDLLYYTIIIKKKANLYESLNHIKMNQDFNRNNIKVEGTKWENMYVCRNFKTSEIAFASSSPSSFSSRYPFTPFLINLEAELTLLVDMTGSPWDIASLITWP